MRGREPGARRITYLLLIAVTLVLFNAHPPYFGPLNLRF